MRLLTITAGCIIVLLVFINAVRSVDTFDVETFIIHDVRPLLFWDGTYSEPVGGEMRIVETIPRPIASE